MADIKVGTVREFAEELADKTYDLYDEKELFSFIFLDETNLNKDEITDSEIDEGICWYGVRTTEMFDCIYLCFGKWGGHSGVSITSSDDNWYLSESREYYVEGIIDSILEVGNYSGKEANDIMIVWEPIE